MSTEHSDNGSTPSFAPVAAAAKPQKAAIQWWNCEGRVVVEEESGHSEPCEARNPSWLEKCPVCGTNRRVT